MYSPPPPTDPRSVAESALGVIRALDSLQRLQILLKLSERDHVVHELVAALGKSQPLVSQHLRVLKRAGLVHPTRIGREIAYHLDVPEAATLIQQACDIANLSSTAEPPPDTDSRRPADGAH